MIITASYIQNGFVNRLNRKNRNIKQAGFIVLKYTYMPSVLIELGFLSNKKEGAYLNSPKGQSEMAEAISNAVINYKNEFFNNLITSNIEENKVSSYNGDSGVIVGFGTTSVGIGTTQFIFDLHIPNDSFLRNAGLSTGVVSTAITASSLSAGDYFIVFGSNVGSATTSITSLDTSGSTVGIGTSYIDNVYQVASSETVYRPTGVNSEGVGIGTSHITRVFVTVDNNFPYGVGIQTSNSFGEFSWGKIQLSSRSKVISYSAFTLRCVGGITTSSFIQTSKALKFKN